MRRRGHNRIPAEPHDGATEAEQLEPATALEVFEY